MLSLFTRQRIQTDSQQTDSCAKSFPFSDRFCYFVMSFGTSTNYNIFSANAPGAVAAWLFPTSLPFKSATLKSEPQTCEVNSTAQ